MKLISSLLCLLGLTIASGAEPPFTVSIVPESRSAELSSVTWSDDSKSSFFVVLTNVTEKPQLIFESGNSWGYRAISFEITLPDGSISQVQPKQQRFTVNAPSTYLVAANGHQVFPITLNKEWESKPDFAKENGMKIKLKAVYSLVETPESKKTGIWAGKIESEQMEVIIRRK